MSEAETKSIAQVEPPDDVVFIRRRVDRLTDPGSDPPYRQLHIVDGDLCMGLGCNMVQVDIDRELLAHLAYQGASPGLAALDMSSWKVPDIWIPAPGRNTVAEKYLLLAVEGGSDDGGHKRTLVAAWS